MPQSGYIANSELVQAGSTNPFMRLLSSHRRMVKCDTGANKPCLKNAPDTVGEFKSVEMGVPHMPAWKAKTLGNLSQERVLLEL